MSRRRRILAAGATIAILVPPLVWAWTVLSTAQFALLACGLGLLASGLEILASRRR